MEQLSLMLDRRRDPRWQPRKSLFQKLVGFLPLKQIRRLVTSPGSRAARFLVQPDMRWPSPTSANVTSSTPLVPSVSPIWLRIIIGYFHQVLRQISQWYMNWQGEYTSPGIYFLPFGLVLKWSEKTAIEEACAMQMARAAGMPVAKVISCGYHPKDWQKQSILMTRLPGYEVQNRREALQDRELEEPWLRDVRRCLETMRTWKSPYSEERICSVIGTSIRSQHIPNHVMGPFENKDEMYDYLVFEARGEHSDDVKEDLALANQIRTKKHRTVFSHGDFQWHQILIDEKGNLTGILDWESAGWLPEYWEFTVVDRFFGKSWWGEVMSRLEGNKYAFERKCDQAMYRQTMDSYIW